MTRVGHIIVSILSDAPKPHIDWYVDASFTTISALPIGPGDTKLIGLGDRFV